MQNSYPARASAKEPWRHFDAAALVASLPPQPGKKITALALFDALDSTNDYLLSKGAPCKGFALCMAKSQSKGRGRRGRAWASPAGGNIYLSLAWHKHKGYRCDGWLGLMIALELARCLSEFSPSFVGVKWPNDICCEGRKLGGILAEKAGSLYVVGLGLNVMTNEMRLCDIGGNRTSLQDVGVSLHRYPQIVAAIIAKMIDAIEFVARGDIARMQSLYRPFDLIYGRNVRVRSADGDFVGTADGVDDRGLLRVTTSASVKLCCSNETSVRL